MVKREMSMGLYTEAQKYLVGGVDSPVRAFDYVATKPLIIKSGRGSRVYDQDGKEYIDYVLSWGSLILGHAFPKVINSVKKVIDSGFSFGTTNRKEIELAKFIHAAIPSIEKVRFVNSGTEAVMGAVRLARGYTGRDKIVKFENSYHGHADYLLVRGGSGLTTLGLSTSAGVPDDFLRHTLVAPNGDREAVRSLFKKHGSKIAAVLFEPVGGNNGVMPPDLDFIRYLRAVTQEYETLLIADEVITGFRFNFGSFVNEAGIAADLICLGKIIGGGLPIGAYGGSEKIMRQLAPLGRVYQASTFSGNPVVMQAGLATLQALKKHERAYRYLDELTAELALGFAESARLCNVDAQMIRYGSLFSFRFRKRAEFATFYRDLLEQGVFFAPSEFEANFVSLAHTKQDIKKTGDQIRQALSRSLRQ